MSWHRGRLLPLDTETTSKDPLEARLVTISLLIVVPGEPHATALEWMVAVDEEIPVSATAKHGITTEVARAKGAPLAEVLTEFDTALRGAWSPTWPVVGMNACYDLTVLAAERDRCGLPPYPVTDETPVIDLLVCDRQVDRYRKGPRSLESLCAHYCVPLADAHNSTADALATARVAWKLANRNPYLAEMAPADLHRKQIEWYREQALGLAAFWRTPKAVAKIERDHAAGLTTRDEADELIRTLNDRADDVERNADGWPMRARTTEGSGDEGSGSTGGTHAAPVRRDA